MGGRPPDPPRLGDMMNAGSSAGWTDEKHMLYISSLEESFVTQLYDGKVKSNGGFCRSSSVWGHRIFTGNRTDPIVSQGYWGMGMDETDRAESRSSQIEHISSLSYYGHQENSKSYNMGDDASTTEPRQDRMSYCTKQNNPAVSSSSHWHGHSSSWITELSDQNFSDQEAGVNWEQSRACSKRRLKHPAGTNNGLVASPGATNLEGYYSGSSSDLDIELLNAETASPSWKTQGPRTWSV